MEISKPSSQTHVQWSESFPLRDESWLTSAGKKLHSAAFGILRQFKAQDSLVLRGQPDEKTIQMYRLHAGQSYLGLRAALRLFLLLTWSLRARLNGSLKRALDLCISVSGLPFILPIMLLTAVAIKLDSPGPVLFKQKRVGKFGKTFMCLKFRSMYIDAEARKQELMDQNEADEVVFKMKQDPRVTRVGRVIRKLSIDELPQIFNVLKGDMSLVGPRPPVPIELENYQYDHFRRLEAIPGLTGLQQVSGRSELAFKRWVELDVQYIEEQSLGKDIEILLKTVPTVISGRGAY